MRPGVRGSDAAISQQLRAFTSGPAATTSAATCSPASTSTAPTASTASASLSARTVDR
jgi:hypothetical protein